jgi:hypothetical protein
MGRISVGWLFTWLLLLLPLRADAVGVQPLSIEALAREADLVLHGKVLSKTTQRDPAGRIFTAVELNVLEVWKGAIGNNPFLVVHGGGILGEEESSVSGQVQYSIGEEVVAFLVRNERGEGVTLAMTQGKFHVWEHAQTKAKLAANPFHGLAYPTAGMAVAKNVTTGTIPPGSLTISDLKKRVTEAVQ